MKTAALWLVRVTELTARLMSVWLVLLLLLCLMGRSPLITRPAGPRQADAGYHVWCIMAVSTWGGGKAARPLSVL